MIVKLDVIFDGPDIFLMGWVDDRVCPPVKMPSRLTRFEVELEAIRRFLVRHQNWRYIAFEVDPYVADVLAFRRERTSEKLDRAANRVNYLVRTRPGPVSFQGRWGTGRRSRSPKRNSRHEG